VRPFCRAHPSDGTTCYRLCDHASLSAISSAEGLPDPTADEFRTNASCAGSRTYTRHVAAIADTTVTLADGRRLAYTEWGDPNGSPLLYFHGYPASRLMCPDERATLSAGVRLIAPDRPGVGRSDVQEGRTIADWPADVDSLADALGIDRFPASAFQREVPTPPRGVPWRLSFRETSRAYVGPACRRAGMATKLTYRVPPNQKTPPRTCSH
jgi:alpha/beta hydrolase family protein